VAFWQAFTAKMRVFIDLLGRPDCFLRVMMMQGSRMIGSKDKRTESERFNAASNSGRGRDTALIALG
jgi:hypothetical protein